jgi:hypothetical protein
MVVVKSEDSSLSIKLIDFAFSKECTKEMIIASEGTLNCMPPE